jgi:hypothetical protein
LWDLQITDTIRVPEVAFTGDTTPDFILDKANKDVLEAKLLIMEVSFPIPYAAVVIETEGFKEDSSGNE